VTSDFGSVKSEEATLHFGDPPVITVQPESVETQIGKTATFTVEAEGENLTYQWYFHTATGPGWNRINGATAAIYSLKTAARHEGYHYYCKVSNEFGSVNSEEATLSFGPVRVVLDDVTYAALEDETTCMIESYAGNASALVIPYVVEGMSVVEVGEGAFENNSTLESISLPGTITAIRARAFKNCTNLREMTETPAE
jgi:hypothetical protein